MTIPVPGANQQAPAAPAASPAVPPVQPTPSTASVVAAPAPAKPAVPATPAPQAGGMVPLAALQEERERRQSLQADLEALKAQVGKLQAPQQAYQQSAPAPQVDHTAELNRLWETDPRRAVQYEIMMAAHWQDNINAQVDHEAESLAAKYKDFNNFRGETMRYVRSLPLEQRNRQGIVEMAYMLARGQNVDQLIEQQRAQLQQQFQQNPAMFQTPTGSGPSPLPTAPVGVLTDEEVRVAEAMGLTPEQYAVGKRK